MIELCHPDAESDSRRLVIDQGTVTRSCKSRGRCAAALLL
jgi:hypothetical protein